MCYGVFDRISSSSLGYCEQNVGLPEISLTAFPLPVTPALAERVLDVVLNVANHILNEILNFVNFFLDLFAELLEKSRHVGGFLVCVCTSSLWQRSHLKAAQVSTYKQV